MQIHGSDSSENASLVPNSTLLWRAFVVGILCNALCRFTILDCLLFRLYLDTLQATINGLVTGSIPILLTLWNVPLSEVGTFAFVTWPLSLKLLWSPLVDSYFIQAFGKRKSWICPALVLNGILLVWISTKCDMWFAEVRKKLLGYLSTRLKPFINSHNFLLSNLRWHFSCVSLFARRKRLP